MRILSRYIIIEILKMLLPLWVALGFLLFILEWMAQVFTVNASATTILLLYAYKVPAHLQLVFPVAVLLSLLIVLGNLNRSREIVAAQSMGVPVRGLLFPCFIALLVAASLDYFVMNKFAPWGMRRHYELMDVGVNKVPSRFSQIKKERIWYRNQDVLYSAGYFDPEKSELFDVTIYTFDDDFYIAQKIYAQKARWNGKYWLLQEGTVFLTDKNLEIPIAEPFKTRSTTLLEEPASLTHIEFNPQTMQQDELRRAIRRNRSLGINTSKWEVVYHGRYSFFLVSLVFLFLAFPLALRFSRKTGVGKETVFAVSVCLVYWLVYNFGVGLGGSGKVRPVIAAWGPSVVFFVAVLLFNKSQSFKKTSA